MDSNQQQINIPPDALIELFKIHLENLRFENIELKKSITILGDKMDSRLQELSRHIQDQQAWRAEIKGSIRTIHWVVGTIIAIMGVAATYEAHRLFNL